MFVGLLIFGAVVLWRTGKTILLGLAQSRVQVIDIAILLLAAAPVGGFLIGAITLPYLGDFANASNPEILISKIEEYARLTGGAAYPAWIVPNSFVELLLQGPGPDSLFSIFTVPLEYRDNFSFDWGFRWIALYFADIFDLAQS